MTRPEPTVNTPALLLSWLFAAGMLLAIPDGMPEAAEPRQDINYRADGGGSIETVDGVRVTTLEGNVRITHGDSRLEGNRATLRQDPESGEFQQATVSGSPARFRWTDADGGEPIVGHSETIHYFIGSAEDSDNGQTVVEFSGNASFTRGRTSLQCRQIRHVLETGTTDSPGPCSGVVSPEDD